MNTSVDGISFSFCSSLTSYVKCTLISSYMYSRSLFPPEAEVTAGFY